MKNQKSVYCCKCKKHTYFTHRGGYVKNPGAPDYVELEEFNFDGNSEY